MKTAISIPGPLFEAAERLAKQLRVSRSELYARAVRSFVEARSHQAVTEALDRLYGAVESKPDPVLSRAQFAGTEPEDW